MRDSRRSRKKFSFQCVSDMDKLEWMFDKNGIDYWYNENGDDYEIEVEDYDVVFEFTKRGKLIDIYN